MNNNSGIAMLIQPFDCIDTDIYKLCFYDSCDLLKHMLSYQEKPRYIHIIELNNIINEFNKIFTPSELKNEYIGPEDKIIHTFLSTVMLHNKNKPSQQIYTCKICSKCFNTRYDLIRHKNDKLKCKVEKT